METTILTSAKTKWVLDPTHSELTFKVRHLMISNVKGEFRKFTAEIDGEDFTTAPIKVSIDASSIDMNDDNRNGHLKAADFFDVEIVVSILFVVLIYFFVMNFFCDEKMSRLFFELFSYEFIYPIRFDSCKSDCPRINVLLSLFRRLPRFRLWPSAF